MTVMATKVGPNQLVSDQLRLVAIRTQRFYNGHNKTVESVGVEVGHSPKLVLRPRRGPHCYRFGSISTIEPSQDRGYVSRSGAVTDEERGCDVFVAASTGHQV